MARPPEPIKSAEFIAPPLGYTDDWARIQSEMIARDRAAAESSERLRSEELKRKDARRRWWWTGVAWCVVGALVVAVILGITFAIWSTINNNDERRVLREREQTEQVQACTALEEPIERQFCILGLNVPQSQTEKGR